jgi:hypothetical protein
MIFRGSDFKFLIKMNKNKILVIFLTLLGVSVVIIVLVVALRGRGEKSYDEISKSENYTNINGGGSQEPKQEPISQEKGNDEPKNIPPNKGTDDSGAEKPPRVKIININLGSDPKLHEKPDRNPENKFGNIPSTPKVGPTLNKDKSDNKLKATKLDIDAEYSAIVSRIKEQTQPKPINDYFASEPHFLKDVKVPNQTYDLSSLTSLTSRPNSDKFTEFMKQPTAATLHQIVLNFSASPDKTLLSDFLFLIDELLSLGPRDKYLGNLKNFVQLQLELLNFSDESPISFFVREKLLKTPILVSYIEFTSLIFKSGTLISSQDPLNLKNLLSQLALVSSTAKEENKEKYSISKFSLFSYYYVLEKKFLALEKIIELCQANLPEPLNADYNLLIQSGFSYEMAIEFVKSFYTKVPIPLNDSIFSAIDKLFSFTTCVESFLNYDRETIPDFLPKFPKGPLPYYEYKRFLGLIQITIELAEIEKSLGLTDGAIFNKLFSDLTTPLPPLQTFDSALFKYRDILFKNERMTLALDRYNDGVDVPDSWGTTTWNDLSAIYSSHKRCALSKFKVENFLPKIIKLKPDLEKELTDLISKILKLPFDNGSDHDLRASLLSLWDMIEPLGNITDNILEDLMNSISDYYYWNRQYECTFPERLRGVEKPDDRKLFLNLSPGLGPFHESQWKTRVSEWQALEEKINK